MAQEEKANLRLFCTAIECPVWESIQKEEENVDSEKSRLRLHCSETCMAYKFNRWIGMSNRVIVPAEERYK